MENKKKQTKSTISSTAWTLFISKISDWLPSAFNFWMIVLATFALGIFFPYSLFITVPFALIPFFFALQMTMADGHKNGQISSKVFFGYYLTYFKEPFAGSYRVIRNFLVAFLYGSLAYLLAVFITYYILAGTDSNFLSAVNEATSLLQSGDTAGLVDFLNNSASLLKFTLIVTAVEESAFFIAFLHNLARYTISPYVRFVASGAPSRMVNQIYVGTLRNIRGTFLKEYYGAIWWLIVLGLLGYAGGFAIGYLFLNFIGITGVVVAGAFGSFLLLSFFIPYFINVNSLLAQKYRNSFSDYSITLAENTLQQLQNAQRLSDEQAKMLQKSIDEAKTKMEERNNSQDDKDDKDEK